MGSWIKKNIFVITFFCFGFLFTYYNFAQHKNLAFYLKLFIVPSLIISYLVDNQTNNSPLFILILFFAFLGDLLFNLETQLAHILGMGSYLCFVLLLMIVVSKEAKEIVLSTFLRYLMPFLFLFILIVYFFFDYDNVLSFIYLIAGAIIAVFCTFSFYYYLKDRNKKSLYYFIGCMCFILTGFTKMYNSFYEYYSLTKVINNLSYIFALYLFYRAVTTKINVEIESN